MKFKFSLGKLGDLSLFVHFNLSRFGPGGSTEFRP